MSVSVYSGPVREDGGTIFTAVGPANAGIEWELTGNGELTPTQSFTDANGIATASYDPTGGTPAQEGDTITVEARCYPS